VIRRPFRRTPETNYNRPYDAVDGGNGSDVGVDVGVDVDVDVEHLVQQLLLSPFVSHVSSRLARPARSGPRRVPPVVHRERRGGTPLSFYEERIPPFTTGVNPTLPTPTTVDSKVGYSTLIHTII